MKRWLVVVALLALIYSASIPASAQPVEIVHCWYESDGNFGGQGRVVCRIAGSDTIIDYVIIDPPPRLWPAVGDDGAGECWYNQTAFTRWRIINEYADGSAYFWYSPDDDWAGPWIDVGTIRRCTSEPVEITTIIDLVWEAVATYDFAEPDAQLQPETGVTGLATFMDLDPPGVDTESFSSPITSLVVDVEFVVTTVVVDWGDGDIQEVPPSIFDLFGRYPDGEITHTYETKEYYDASVEYLWRVRYRIDGGVWQNINNIDPTTWAVTYQVDEIVTRVTG